MASVLVTLAVTSVSPPPAVAEDTPPPAPTELWRHFPLITQNPAAREREPAEPAASAPEPQSRATAGEGRGRSLPIQIALGAFAGALVFLLVIATLVYAGRDHRGYAVTPGKRDRKRRVRDFATTVRAYGEPTAVVQPAAASLDEDAGAQETATSTKTMLPSEKVPRDARGDPGRTLADDELEILKAKLGKPVAPVDDEPADAVERLKTKLAHDTGVKKAETARPSVLKTKLAEGPTPSESLARKASVAALKAKLEREDRSPKTPPEPRPDTDGHDQARQLPPQESQSEAPVPAAPRTISAASHRPPVALDDALAIRCRIVWWRGYVKSLFYAVARTASGKERVLAESPRFRWSEPNPPPDAPPAVGAHRSLVQALERDGWSVARTVDHWFALELERRHRPVPTDNGGENQ